MAVSKDEILDAIANITVLDVVELIKAMEDKFGVTAAAPVAMAAAPSAAAAAPVAEEQTEFDVVLTGFGEKKIQVIKAVREITGLGLKEAKDLVDGAPKPVKEGVDKAAILLLSLSEEDAAQILKHLEPKQVQKLGHLHHEFLDAWVSHGLMGILSLLVLATGMGLVVRKLWVPHPRAAQGILGILFMHLTAGLSNTNMVHNYYGAMLSLSVALALVMAD